ncbi:MAG: CAP domain-containing protein [Thermotogae bacterium]|nr:CAP domain-containing protein [Thermotogota bacterium]
MCAVAGGFEMNLFSLINAYRRERGVKELAWSDSLFSLARAHTEEILDGHKPHYNFDARFERATIWGFRLCAENISINVSPHPPPPFAVLEGWRRSPGHDANLLRDLSHGAVAWGRKGDMHVVVFFACR